ncbi:ABC transporter permease [Natronobacterium gregoryi]|uniref:ABC transporter permease n=2 Tax=Natronobacterium gregoryi TaxID=44930 RepID=L0ADR6_NATGS|nr:ABC transporter permease [Natronobacterium gregoryi]AFZ72048.1 ABC-type dipeptide/oligopeptide/nickel transport system, permease component [Natronobacterium gregoryi SP2]ELY62780.1 ABC transporter permease [Natronobacterium gregoryi SP2]PLK20896.1 ABC transporter permease [Natronobacterium gregoryi SP2]SFJ45029.1 peptide/nickel transport system permease protein [Natronobacterium gregoryi]
MKWYILRRLLWAGFASWIILSVTFLLMDLVPDQRIMQAEFAAAQEGVDPEAAAAAAEERYGVAGPLHERYVDYLTGFVQGDWGWSIEYSQPVADVIVTAAPYSAMYAVPAVIIATIIGTAIGLYSAVNQYTTKDYAATFGAFFGISLPNFWFAIVLLVIFGTMLGWVDVGWNHYYPISQDGGFTLLERADDSHPAFVREEFEGERYVGVLSPANLQQLVLPAFVLLTTSTATVMRYARAEALEYVDADFVKTAKAKGASDWAIVSKHIFRPASVPLMTIFVGRMVGLVLVGSYLIEIVFGIPGIGLASYEAIIRQDTDLVAITILIPTFLAIVGNLIEDITYAILDPRIDYGDR